MPPRESHEKIFMTWKLGLGETLKIINDHDPKPLHYQFEAEMPETYEWKYEGYTARNPKTGVRVEVALKALPFLKAGKEPHSGIHLIFCLLLLCKDYKRQGLDLPCDSHFACELL